MAKTALITGGSSGLGLEMARNLAARGYHLILIARDPTRLACAREELRQRFPVEVEIHSCDVADEQALSATFAGIRAGHKAIDFLILNAGVATIDLLADYRSLPEVTQNLRINLLGVISTVYLAGPVLHRGAQLLFISSGFGLVGSAGYSLYAAAKAGINNFADALRRELLGRGISVHLACPGDIDTPMLEGELRSMPDWIRQKMGRARPMPADHAARYILDRCARGHFMIVPSPDVSLLVLMQKLLPRRLSTYMIDRILPLPPVPAR